jgi:hypothetical protein
MEPHALPRSEVNTLLKNIIQTRTERNRYAKESNEYVACDAQLDALLEDLARRFLESPTKGMMRMEEQLLPPEEEEDEFYPISSQFDPVEEVRRAVPDSKNETPAYLETPPSEDTPEQKKERERLTKLFETL